MVRYLYNWNTQSLLHWKLSTKLAWWQLSVTESCHHANFVVSGSSEGCHYVNLMWHLRLQSWHHNDSQLTPVMTKLASWQLLFFNLFGYIISCMECCFWKIISNMIWSRVHWLCSMIGLCVAVIKSCIWGFSVDPNQDPVIIGINVVQGNDLYIQPWDKLIILLSSVILSLLNSWYA